MQTDGSNKIKLLCFDLDDTLWPVKPALIAAEKEVASYLNLHCPEVYQRYDIKALAERRHALIKQLPKLRHQISQLRIETMASVIAECGYPEVKARKLANDAFSVFIDARHKVDYFPNVESVLHELHQRYTIAALTNGNAHIERLSIGKYFKYGINAEDINASKPSADHFEHAMQRSCLQPQELIHIGDHPQHDIYGAHQLGIKTIWVNLDDSQWTEPYSPNVEINAIKQLPAAIAQLDCFN